MSGGVRMARGHGGRGHHHHGRGRRWWKGGYYPYPYGYYPYLSYPYTYGAYYDPYAYYGSAYGYPVYAQSFSAQQEQPVGPIPQDCCVDEVHGELDCNGGAGDGTAVQVTNRKYYGGGQIVYVNAADPSRSGWYWSCPQ